MKWLKKLWPKKAPDEVQEAMDRRLEEIERDAVRVAALRRRGQRLVRENNLAPIIIKALRSP